MYRTFTASLAVLLLAGCGSSVSTVSTSEKPGAYTVFDSANGVLAYPNNVLFAGSADGTLNIPFDPTAPDAGIKSQLNTLDGFSTTSSVTLPLTGAVDESTLAGNVRVFKVTAAALPETQGIPAVVATEKELVYGSDYITVLSGNKIAIVPLKPLEGHSNYMVIVTDGVHAANGGTLAPDATTAMLNGSQLLINEQGDPTAYFDPDATTNTQTAMQLEGLRKLTQMMFAQAGAAGIDSKHIVTAWSFQTQTIGEVQASIAAEASANTDGNLTLADVGFTTKELFGQVGIDTSMMTGSAEIYAGTLNNIPQYMPQGSHDNPMPVLNGSFTYKEGTFMPEAQATVSLPVVTTLPSAASGCEMPTAGWPVVMYMHGITRDRTDLFVFGETLASKCYAGIAIDQPLHGVTDATNPFYMGSLERTFNVDIVTEEPYGVITAFAPDGVIDSTGINFMNLAHVMTTRDNLQQATSDLFELQNALAKVQGTTFDTARVSFLSHSLGTISTIGFINHTDKLKTAVLAMPGQGVLPILTHSEVFTPPLNAGLAAFGIMPGTPEYDTFILASQTIVDDADPANYTMTLGTRSLPLLEFESVGDGIDPNTGDKHIHNSIPSNPIAGTDPLIRYTQALDLNVSALTSTPYGQMYFPKTSKTVTRVTAGEHRSLLDPQYSLEAFVEYHTELISFIDSNGTAILVNDPSIIKQ